MQVNAGHNLRSKLLHDNVDWQVAVSTSSADDEDAHDVMNSTKPKAITYFQLSVANHCVPSCVSVSWKEGINENWLILFTRYQPGHCRRRLWTSFLRIYHLYSTSLRKPLRGSPKMRTVFRRENCVNAEVREKWWRSRREAIPGRGAHHRESTALVAQARGTRRRPCSDEGELALQFLGRLFTVI